MKSGEEAGCEVGGNTTRDKKQEVRKQGGEKEMMQLPSWAWTSLQIAAACIFLSLVVMVENCDMAPLGRQSMFVQHVQRERGQACGRQRTRWPSILIEIQLQSVGALMAVV